jgi:prepilin-type N-terminal cleavage/methylation domain-containing protein/prepilin-type processing-associated H-X9-DG protein
MNAVTRRPAERTGFTLIEILVVVAIIALLVAILLPSLKNAKELSKATLCGTQLRQIFDGTLIYSQANADRLPYFGGDWSINFNSTPWWWVSQISNNIGNNFGMYKCPTDRKPYQVTVTWQNGRVRMAKSTDPNKVQLDITYRSSCDVLMEQFDKQGNRLTRKINSWRYPARAILLVEADCQTAEAGLQDCFRFQDHMAYLDESTPGSQSRWAAYPWWQGFKRHLGRSNFLFMDGHVERLSPTQAAKLAKHQEHCLANRT